MRPFLCGRPAVCDTRLTGLSTTGRLNGYVVVRLRQTADTKMALCRHSELLLFDLDLDEDILVRESARPTRGGLRICDRSEDLQLREAELEWDSTLFLDELLTDGGWLRAVWGLSTGVDAPGLVAVSLANIGSFRGACRGLLTYKEFCCRKECQTLVQDMYLLLVQLWQKAWPFAFLLQNADQAIFAAVKRLPGVSHRHGRHLLLFYNCASADVPPGLFHLLN